MSLLASPEAFQHTGQASTSDEGGVGNHDFWPGHRVPRTWGCNILHFRVQQQNVPIVSYRLPCLPCLLQVCTMVAQRKADIGPCSVSCIVPPVYLCNCIGPVSYLVVYLVSYFVSYSALYCHMHFMTCHDKWYAIACCRMSNHPCMTYVAPGTG